MQKRINYLFQNGYNSVTRPPIEILSPLFTLQLFILPLRDPFRAQKTLNREEKLRISKFDLILKTQQQGKGHYFKFFIFLMSLPPCDQ